MKDESPTTNKRLLIKTLSLNATSPLKDESPTTNKRSFTNISLSAVTSPVKVGLLFVDVVVSKFVNLLLVSLAETSNEFIELSMIRRCEPISSLFNVIESFTYKFLLNDTSPSVMRFESFLIVRSPPLMSTNPLT